MKRTLDICPVSSSIFTIEGYFHKVNWFWVNPCQLNNSHSFLLHNKEQMWEPLLMELSKHPYGFSRIWCIDHSTLHRRLANCSGRGTKQGIWLQPCGPQAYGAHAIELENAIDWSQMWSRLSLPPLEVVSLWMTILGHKPPGCVFYRFQQHDL